ADVATVLSTVKALSAVVVSLVVLLTLAVLLMVEPLASLALTWTTRVKVALAPAARVVSVAVTVPVPPAGGVVAVNPAAGVKDTKVVPVGTASVSCTAWALEGPALVRVMV